MKILVVPDIHLRKWMIERVAQIMNTGVAEHVVCLGDIVDDWGKEFNLDEYEQIFDALIAFIKKYSTSICWGNHDWGYRIGERISGGSPWAREIVVRKQFELMDLLEQQNNPIKHIHRYDDVLFSHAGLTEEYAMEHEGADNYDKIDLVIEKINGYSTKDELWVDNSILWARPQLTNEKMYQSDKLLQVVGHTPMERLTKVNNLLSVDVFSTYRDGRPIGSQEFTLIDTETWQFCGIK